MHRLTVRHLSRLMPQAKFTKQVFRYELMRHQIKRQACPRWLDIGASERERYIFSVLALVREHLWSRVIYPSSSLRPRCTDTIPDRDIRRNEALQ
ncbi:hypothetical protein DOTSEDRAFT_68986 [Dothistroma septosporum NZE10]|uniref:Uncharacterized protein n=1 Tax=Dothistroma septosporum (strain NZE10 / CBS 128990) TaxID=675120 RepID=N1Q5A1_DOTSN|nr:hypothetical protein DOTSEDRAFT_68986 [Dothistroma septosporum NZE10]